MVITGEPIELPREIESLAVRFELILPDDQEIRETVRQVVDSMSARRKTRVELSREDAVRLVRSLSGLTLNQVRRVIAQAIVADDKLSGQDIDRVIRWIIERGGLLEFFPVEGNTFEIGGFSRLKTWLEHAKVGFSAEARALNLAAPKGVLFVGVQGCGKSLAAKFIAREWNMPLLKLDAGRLFDKYVGESEKNFHRATSLAGAMAPVILWIDELEKAFGQAGSNEAEGEVRRDLLRRPSGRGRAADDLLDSPATPKAGSDAVRHREALRRDRGLQRCRDRAGRDLRPLPRAPRKVGAHDGEDPRGRWIDGAAVGDAQRTHRAPAPESAEGRFTPVR